jgi:hypothetical protein
MTVQKDIASYWVVESHYELSHRTLSGARRADNGRSLSRREYEAQVVSYNKPRPRRIYVLHVLKFDGAVD